MFVVEIRSDHSHRTRLLKHEENKVAWYTTSVLKTYIHGEFAIKIIVLLRIGIFHPREVAVEVQLIKNMNVFKEES